MNATEKDVPNLTREEKYAGECAGGGRHKWGEEFGWTSAWKGTAYHRCQKCLRVAIRQYGNSGNSIRGYANEIPREHPD